MNTQELNNLINSEENLIIVKINASWCIACRTMKNNIMRSFPNYSDKVKLIEIDVETSPEIPRMFKINIIPSLIFIKNKEVIKTLSGIKSPELFEQTLKELIND